MILYLVGISCVGKTTIGAMLAQRLGFPFFDLDLEIQKHYGMPIERIQNECLSMNEYRKKGSIVLDKFFSEYDDCVIAGTPSGLMFSYLEVYLEHKNKDLISICLTDSPENVLKRITFYDKDSNPIVELMDESKRCRYLNGIKEDYDYFKNSYKKADFKINIRNLGLDKIPDFIIKRIDLKMEK